MTKTRADDRVKAELAVAEHAARRLGRRIKEEGSSFDLTHAREYAFGKIAGLKIALDLLDNRAAA